MNRSTKMVKAAALFVTYLISFSISAQQVMKEVQLTEGVCKIEYNDLNLEALLLVYGEKSATHLRGDVSLRISNEETTVAEYYINHDSREEEYLTRIYKNYFLTFDADSVKNLVVEQARFGKVFTLSSKESATIGEGEDTLEIEIVDVIHEWGYDGPPEDESRSYFENVQYSIQVKTGAVVENISFYSSALDGSFAVDIDQFNIQILSDKYNNTYSLVEMKVNKK